MIVIRFFSLHKSDTTQTLFICCVSLERSRDLNHRCIPVYTYLHFKTHALFQHTSAIPNPYTLANCSLLSLHILKSLIKNELYVDNFTVNIQHSHPVEENAEVEGDTW
jgi:hypothetical protein